ncbi:eukaryotic initiation factor 4A [Elysia marginata]|uniref:RNA helicase n=1 Tax=Elysia marginata TaxID=1093978 RepID=A0AAV4IMT9_9GAST|nr:eukaryotic initiation factor 4A [Elysia marginata]
MSIAHKFDDRVRTNDVLISETVDFPGLLLSKPVLKGLADGGFQKPSPIQLKAIPLGRCGLGQKKMEKDSHSKCFDCGCKVLVLAPTREIAQQIQGVIQKIGSAMPGLKCHTFIGGLPILQDKIMCKNCHIAVGTPGRVKQLLEIGALKAASIRLFVLDEADKLLQDSFQESINWIYSSLPENKQILALSATYPEYLADHLTRYMRNPTFVRLNAADPALLGIKQYHVVVPNHPMPNIVFSAKTETVVKIISSVSFQQCLIFSNMQTRAQDLQSELQARNWPTACIAGCLQQQERSYAMDQLKTYKCRILISTDLTSRGIDADKVNLVINLDVPPDHETYLHRIGRAGRFGSFGAAVTIVSKGSQEKDLWRIEKCCRTYIHKLPDPLPNDLVTRPVPVRLDDIVSTEQIINESGSEASQGCTKPGQVPDQAGDNSTQALESVTNGKHSGSPSMQKRDYDPHNFHVGESGDKNFAESSGTRTYHGQALLLREYGDELHQYSPTLETTGINEKQSRNLTEEQVNGQPSTSSLLDTVASDQKVSNLPGERIIGQSLSDLPEINASLSGKQKSALSGTSEQEHHSSPVSGAGDNGQQQTPRSETPENVQQLLSDGESTKSLENTGDTVLKSVLLSTSGVGDLENSPQQESNKDVQQSLTSTGNLVNIKEHLPISGMDDGLDKFSSMPQDVPKELSVDENRIGSVNTNAAIKPSLSSGDAVTSHFTSDTLPLTEGSQEIWTNAKSLSESKVEEVINENVNEQDRKSEVDQSVSHVNASKLSASDTLSLTGNKLEIRTDAKPEEEEVINRNIYEEDVKENVDMRNNQGKASKIPDVNNSECNEENATRSTLSEKDSDGNNEDKNLLRVEQVERESSFLLNLESEITGESENAYIYHNENQSITSSDAMTPRSLLKETDTDTTWVTHQLSVKGETQSLKDVNPTDQLICGSVTEQCFTVGNEIYNDEVDNCDGIDVVGGSKGWSASTRDIKDSDTQPGADVSQSGYAVGSDSMTKCLEEKGCKNDSNNLDGKVEAGASVGITELDNNKKQVNLMITAMDTINIDEQRAPATENGHRNSGISPTTVQSKMEPVSSVKSPTKTQESASSPEKRVAKANRKSHRMSFAMSSFLEQLQTENESLNSLAAAKIKVLGKENAQGNFLSEKIEEKPREVGTESRLKDSSLSSLIEERKVENIDTPEKLADEGISKTATASFAIDNKTIDEIQPKFKSYARSRESKKHSFNSEARNQDQLIFYSLTKEPEDAALFTQEEAETKRFNSVASLQGAGAKNTSKYPIKPSDTEKDNANKGLVEEESLNTSAYSGKVGQLPDRIVASLVEHAAEEAEKSLNSISKNPNFFLSTFTEMRHLKAESSFYDLEKSFQMLSKTCDGGMKIPPGGCSIFKEAQNFSDDLPQIQAHCREEVQRLKTFKICWAGRKERAAGERRKSLQENTVTPDKQNSSQALEKETPTRFKGPLPHNASSFEKALYEHVKGRKKNNDKAQSKKIEGDVPSPDISIQKEEAVGSPVGSTASRDIQQEESPLIGTDDPHERRVQLEANDDECKQLDEMHEQMLRRRMLRKANKKLGSLTKESLTEVQNLPDPFKESSNTSLQSLSGDSINLEHTSKSQPGVDLGEEEFNFSNNQTNNATQNHLHVPGTCDLTEGAGMFLSQNLTSASGKGAKNVKIEAFASETKSKPALDGQDSEKAEAGGSEIVTEQTPSAACSNPRILETQRSAKKSLTPIFDALYTKQQVSHKAIRCPLKTLWQAGETEVFKDRDVSRGHSPEAEVTNLKEKATKESLITLKKRKGRNKETEQSNTRQTGGKVCSGQTKKSELTEGTLPPTKPSKSAARLAGLEVSDGPTSSSSSSSSSTKSSTSQSTEANDSKSLNLKKSATDRLEDEDSSDDIDKDIPHPFNYAPYPSFQYYPWNQRHPQQATHPAWFQHFYWPGFNYTLRNSLDKFYPYFAPSSTAAMQPYHAYHPHYQNYYSHYYSHNLYPALQNPHLPSWNPYVPRDRQYLSHNFYHQTGRQPCSLDSSMQWEYVCHMTQQSIRLGKKFKQSMKLRKS